MRHNEQYTHNRTEYVRPCKCPACKGLIRWVGHPGDWPAKGECPHCGVVLFFEVIVRYKAEIFDEDTHQMSSCVQVRR